MEGDLDLRGTLGVDKEVPAGFEAVRVAFDVQAPEASAEQLASLAEKTERCCTVFRPWSSPRRPGPGGGPADDRHEAWAQPPGPSCAQSS